MQTIPSTCKSRRVIAALLALGAATGATAEETRELLDLSLEELGNIEVTSVSKRAEPLLDAAASIFVITREDILRSGVTSIPEALRLAPGVEVARRNAHEWSISIRGFNRDLTNKLLVLIDGRSVYSPLYAGVFWDVQDTLLQDVDRIEVISGPGGTLWGANAVNGVINIITRSATETKGSYFELGGGIEERGFAGFRYGSDIGNDAAVRAYVKYFDRDSSRRIDGGDAPDDWRMARGGFRADWKTSPADQFRLQGDLYSGEKTGSFLGEFTLGTLPDGSFTGDIDLAGGNLLMEWTRQLEGSAGFQLQVYYDLTRRDIPNTYKEKRDTLNIDFQHRFRVGNRHDLLWGAGFRLTGDDLGNTTFATFTPDSRTDRTFSLFVQDRIDLRNNSLYLVLGSKFENNDYTGFEWQPNARLSWLLSDRQTMWFAVSRAVRIPSRIDADLRLTAPLPVPTLPFPVYLTIEGSRDFESEELLAYESGYRIQASDTVNLDLAVFYNDYDNLQTVEPEAPIFALPSYIIVPNRLANNMQGESYGGTFMLNWQPAKSWRLRFQYAFLDLSLENLAVSQDVNTRNIAGNSPRHQYSVFSFLDFLNDFSLYTALRHVGDLPNQQIEDYTALDLGLRWYPSDNSSVSLTGQNLNDSGHPEFGGFLSETERMAYLKFAWSM